MKSRMPLLLAAALAVGCSKGIDPPELTPIVHLSGGEFTMGSRDQDPCDRAKIDSEGGILASCHAEEQSEAVYHNVYVEPFCMDEHEVTINQFRHCVALGDCAERPRATGGGQPGTPGAVSKYYTNHETYGDYPVMGITWDQAVEYCRYRGGRLPTEAEWEWAAKGGRDDQLYVWDDLELLDRCHENRNAVAYGECSSEQPLPVKIATADKTAHGIHDLAGNAAEWVLDRFDYLAYCETDQGEGKIDDLFDAGSNHGRFPVPKNAEEIVEALLDDDDNAACYATESKDGCGDQLSKCFGWCGSSFRENEKDADAGQEWRVKKCADEIGRLKITGRPCGDDPSEGECRDKDDLENPDAFKCRQLCECVEGEVAPSSDAACVQQCVTDLDGCLHDGDKPCFADSARVVCTPPPPAESGSRPRPTCRARTASLRDKQTPYVDDWRHGSLEGWYVVRGASFQSTWMGADRPCSLRTSRRRKSNVHNQNIGFRCAYSAGDKLCKQ